MPVSKSFPLLFSIFFLASSAFAQAERDAYLDQLPPLIDREVFFGDPEISGAQLSPDGEFVSFLKPLDGVMNVWVKRRTDGFDDAWPVTADRDRPVRGYFWSRDSRYVLYVQDKGGDENFHVYAVNPLDEPEPGESTPGARSLTSGENVQARIFSVPRKDPEHIIVGLNDRNPQLHDVFRINITTGNRELLVQNDENVIGWLTDDYGNIRMATRQTAGGGTEILRVLDDKSLDPVYACTFEESCFASRLHPDGHRVYMVSNKGEPDLTHLMIFDPETGEESVVESDPEGEVDLGSAVYSRDGELLATYYVGDRMRIYIRDAEFAQHYDRLKSELTQGDVYVGSRTEDEQMWLVSVTSDVDPGATYVYDMTTGDLEFLYRPRPNLPVEHLAEMQPVRFTARDGREIPAYLTLPKGVEAQNLPVVINPHGGPWARDYWGYDPTAQFLANRGYAVLQPNFRGSSGYGKSFLNAGNREWGTGAMQHDITDGVNWLIEQGIADPERIGIYGGSYGGYATLAGVTFTPDIYAAAIPYVAPSSLITLIESFPAYWRPFLEGTWYRRVGDPSDPQDRADLEARSPLNYVDRIVTPLLVVHGANDPRVTQRESDQLVVALRDRDIDVEYIVAPDEGHGFAGKTNRLALFAAMERFLAPHLGGRYQTDVSDEIGERLNDITVDINTVELPEAPEAAADIETAALPNIDPSRKAAGTYYYQMNMTAMGQDMSMDLTRTVSKTGVNGAEAWLVVDKTETPMGAVTDSTFLAGSTLLPIKRVVNQMGSRITLNYVDGGITGSIQMGGQDMPVNAELEAPVFPDGGGLDFVVASLPLSAGYTTTYRIFDVMRQKSRGMSLEVTDTEAFEVSGKTVDTHVITITPLDGESGGGRYWIASEAPYVVVRAEGQLPPQAGGGKVEMMLTGID